MGIVKTASGVATANSCGNEDLMREERLLLQSSPSEESDGCDQAEVDCELAMSGGQVCNVPYGLYDLPELNDILSLETWNLCLAEDDRLRLAAFLPDMDQHDLFMTLTELFSGSAMFFGSPLRGFFDRLNGGFYSPEVSQARELLMDFQRRRYYHFLKLYHNGMVWKFTCMDKLWRSGSSSLEEKIHIWHNWIHDKLLTFEDPNSSPMNASLSIIGEAEAANSSLLKRAKLMEGTSTTNCSAKHKEVVHIAKSMEASSSKSHIFHLRDEPNENCSKLPKGVLKAKTDGNAGIHQTAGLIPLIHQGLQVSSFSPYASSQHVHNFAMNSSYPYYMNTRRSALGNSSSNPWQLEGALETYPALVKGPFGVQHTVLEELKRGSHAAMFRVYQSAAKHSLAYSNEANDTRESPHEKNLLMNFGQQSAMIPADPYARSIVGQQTAMVPADPYARSIVGQQTAMVPADPYAISIVGQQSAMVPADPYAISIVDQQSAMVPADPVTRTISDHQTNVFRKMPNPRNADTISGGMLTLGTRSTDPPCNNSLGLPESMRKHHDKLKMKAPPVMNPVTKVEEHRLPYTYTRRKLHTGVDIVDPVKTPTMVGSESASVLASMAKVEAKAIKL